MKGVIVFLFTMAWFFGGMAMLVWVRLHETRREFAEHGRCLKLETYQHVPIHHERCIRWER